MTQKQNHEYKNKYLDQNIVSVFFLPRYNTKGCGIDANVTRMDHEAQDA